jgi:hypothetical protein
LRTIKVKGKGGIGDKKGGGLHNSAKYTMLRIFHENFELHARPYFASQVKSSQVKLLASECQTNDAYAKRVKQATKKDNAAACLCFLIYLAFFRPEADRAASILPWVVSRGRSCGFLWADSSLQKKE